MTLAPSNASTPPSATTSATWSPGGRCPGPAIPQLDPFLFLNHHGPQVYPPNNRGLPFGPHPHRGFETVTFILDGELSHLDSGGHESVIGPGGVQWMTAGSGLVHAELSPASFKQAGGPLEILQLWVNLPGRLKMTAPNYLGLQGDEIPKIETDGATLEVISGEIGGVTGPFPSLIGIEMSVVAPGAGRALDLPVAKGRAVFLYVVSGEIVVGGQTAPNWNLVELNDDGDAVAFDSPSGGRGPAGPRPTDRRTGLRPRAVRDEHPRGDHPGDRRLQRRQVREPCRGRAGHPDQHSKGCHPGRSEARPGPPEALSSGVGPGSARCALVSG